MSHVALIYDHDVVTRISPLCWQDLSATGSVRMPTVWTLEVASDEQGFSVGKSNHQDDSTNWSSGEIMKPSRWIASTLYTDLLNYRAR